MGKKIIFSSGKEAEKLTGLQAGGISPFALINKDYHIFIGDKTEKRQTIHDLGVRMGKYSSTVMDLPNLTGARFAWN